MTKIVARSPGRQPPSAREADPKLLLRIDVLTVGGVIEGTDADPDLKAALALLRAEGAPCGCVLCRPGRGEGRKPIGGLIFAQPLHGMGPSLWASFASGCRMVR